MSLVGHVSALNDLPLQCQFIIQVIHVGINNLQRNLRVIHCRQAPFDRSAPRSIRCGFSPLGIGRCAAVMACWTWVEVGKRADKVDFDKPDNGFSDSSHS